MPDADQRLITAFAMLGMCENGGMGIVPLSWREIRAFSLQSEYDLNGWESEQLSRMSREYVSMYRKATDKMSEPPPYCAPVTWDDIASRRDNLSNQLSALRQTTKAAK